MADVFSMPDEDLSARPVSDFTLTRKGQLAVDYGDARLTRTQIRLLTAIAYIQNREADDR